MKRQWEETLGIKCVVELYEWVDFFRKRFDREFQIMLTHWSSSISDPIWTLNIFKDRQEKTNFTGWENREYQKLLDRADRVADRKHREKYLSQAEEIFSKSCYCASYFLRKLLVF